MKHLELKTDNKSAWLRCRWELGYVEAIVVAHCLGKRANGLERVDLHNNSITT